MNFNFGSSTPKTTATVSFGSPANPTATVAAFSLGTTTASTGLTFGSTTPTVGFSLGAGDSSKASPTIPTSAVKPMAAATPISLGPSATTALATPAFPSFGLTSSTPSLAAPQTSTPSFGFGAPTSAPLAMPSFSLAPASSAPAPILKLGTSPAATLTTTPATTTLPTTTPLGMSANTTFVQLEENISKWKLDLEEHEKIFISQAAQINTWDNLLNSNSDKIVALNSDVAAIKVQQQQLTHELDFIVAQQRELEEVLVPLEKQTADAPTSTDAEREQIYHMAETLDTQLKQMSEDLREVIENINETSRTQDSSDPIVQIGRILNAHMNSLQWIDQMTLNIQNHLENVTKLHDTHRRENERSFRISYE